MLQKHRAIVALAICVMPHRDLLEVLDVLIERTGEMPELIRRTILADVEYRVQAEIQVGKWMAEERNSKADLENTLSC